MRDPQAAAIVSIPSHGHPWFGWFGLPQISTGTKMEEFPLSGWIAGRQQHWGFKLRRQGNSPATNFQEWKKYFNPPAKVVKRAAANFSPIQVDPWHQNLEELGGILEISSWCHENTSAPVVKNPIGVLSQIRKHPQWTTPSTSKSSIRRYCHRQAYCLLCHVFLRAFKNTDVNYTDHCTIVDKLCSAILSILLYHIHVPTNTSLYYLMLFVSTGRDETMQSKQQWPWSATPHRSHRPGDWYRTFRRPPVSSNMAGKSARNEGFQLRKSTINQPRVWYCHGIGWSLGFIHQDPNICFFGARPMAQPSCKKRGNEAHLRRKNGTRTRFTTIHLSKMVVFHGKLWDLLGVMVLMCFNPYFS